jgi:Na+/H+ antiporter NhaA
LLKPITPFVFNNKLTGIYYKKENTFAAEKNNRIEITKTYTHMTHNYSFKSMVKKYVNSSVVLIVCAIFALALANSPLKDEFFKFWNQEVSLSIGKFNLFSHNGHPMTLIQVINDFLMAIFFLSVGLEIKREILVGEL